MLDALAFSGLAVDHLDVFLQTRQCSIALPELAAYLAGCPLPKLRAVLASTQSFAISFSVAFEAWNCEKAKGSRTAEEIVPRCLVHGCDFPKVAQLGPDTMYHIQFTDLFEHYLGAPAK